MFLEACEAQEKCKICEITTKTQLFKRPTLINSYSNISGLPWWLIRKESPCKQESGVPSLGQKDPLKKEMVTTSVSLSGKTCGQALGELQPTGSQEWDMTQRLNLPPPTTILREPTRIKYIMNFHVWRLSCGMKNTNLEVSSRYQKWYTHAKLCII